MSVAAAQVEPEMPAQAEEQRAEGAAGVRAEALAGVRNERRTGVPSALFVERVPREFARLHLVVSAGAREEAGSRCETLLVSVRTPRHVVHNVGVRLGAGLEAVVTDDEEIARRIDEAYGALAGAEFATGGPTAAKEHTDAMPAPIEREIERLLADSDRDVLTTAGKGPTVRLVDAMLFEALGRRASDVHVQPLGDRVLVRYRIDGVLQTARVLPRHVAEAVTTRIKVMGRMDVAERRVAQDGRAGVTIGAGSGVRRVDLRISSLPTSHGERVVIRLLDASAGRDLGSFDSLGMPHAIRESYLGLAARPQGVILLTGPTGSGKTTTLYATLRWIASRSAATGNAGASNGLNVMTIEDPIEYELSALGESISQAQVNSKKGVTFANGLRHILRQDPDVIMVGEIRDEPTARIAVQASLTGHLVLSTLHTNDSVGAITRLADLGIERFLIASSLAGAMAQRLVRRSHGACAGRGCGACGGTGFLGRIGLFELLRSTPRVGAGIVAGLTHQALFEVARAEGLRTLREEGARLASGGITTDGEIERVTIGDHEP
jgi:general secretion pathway protein E